MKRGSLFCGGGWPLLVFPLIVLLLLLVFQWRSIEQIVATNASTLLIEQGHQWANVETFNRGRDVLITGNPPSQAAIAQAQQIASQAIGVNRADVGGDVVAPASPVTLLLTFSEETVTVRGELLKQSDIDTLAHNIRTLFDQRSFNNQLQIGENIITLPSLNDFLKSLAEQSLDALTLSLTLSDNTLQLQGQMPSDEVAQTLFENAQRNYQGVIENEMTIAPPVERDVCEDLVNELLEQGKINFTSGKALIMADSNPLLNRIGRIAQRCPTAKFEVTGHTDTIGSEDFNRSLSEQRAKAVVDYLVEWGLEGSRFTPVGYGADRPIAENDTPEGRAQNRRIEFKLKE